MRCVWLLGDEVLRSPGLEFAASLRAELTLDNTKEGTSEAVVRTETLTAPSLQRLRRLTNDGVAFVLVRDEDFDSETLTWRIVNRVPPTWKVGCLHAPPNNARVLEGYEHEASGQVHVEVLASVDPSEIRRGLDALWARMQAPCADCPPPQ